MLSRIGPSVNCQTKLCVTRLILEVLRLYMDAIGADYADGAVHVRLAEELGEAAGLHENVHHVHLWPIENAFCSRAPK